VHEYDKKRQENQRLEAEVKRYQQQITALRAQIGALETSKKAAEGKLTAWRSNTVESLTAKLPMTQTKSGLASFLQTLKNKQSAIANEAVSVQRLVCQTEERLEARRKESAERRIKDAIEKAKTEGREEGLNCSVCFAKEKNVLLKPCGHVCLCQSCYVDITTQPSAAGGRCPVCQKHIEGFAIAYLQ